MQIFAIASEVTFAKDFTNNNLFYFLFFGQATGHVES